MPKKRKFPLSLDGISLDWYSFLGEFVLRKTRLLFIKLKEQTTSRSSILKATSYCYCIALFCKVKSTKTKGMGRMRLSLFYYIIYRPVGMLNRLILDLLIGLIMILT